MINDDNKNYEQHSVDIDNNDEEDDNDNNENEEAAIAEEFRDMTIHHEQVCTKRPWCKGRT